MLVRIDAPYGGAVATELCHTMDLFKLPSLHALDFAEVAAQTRSRRRSWRPKPSLPPLCQPVRSSTRTGRGTRLR